MKILIIGPDTLTELILVEALVAQLYKRHRCEIDLLIPENLHSLVARMPKVNNAIPLPQNPNQRVLTQACFKLGLTLRQQAYYQAINLQPQLPYSFIPFVARIARRTISYTDKFRFLLHYSLSNDRRYRVKNTYGRQLDHLLSLANEPGSTLPKKMRPQLISHDAKRQAWATRARDFFHSEMNSKLYAQYILEAALQIPFSHDYVWARDINLDGSVKQA